VYGSSPACAATVYVYAAVLPGRVQGFHCAPQATVAGRSGEVLGVIYVVASPPWKVTSM
jgi:hypothetical protein